LAGKDLGGPGRLVGLGQFQEFKPGGGKNFLLPIYFLFKTFLPLFLTRTFKVLPHYSQIG